MLDTSKPNAADQRRDAVRNRESLVVAAMAAVHREGLRVPMATIAAAAGVGIGTLYRHFASREELLDHLTHRSFETVLANARNADTEGDSGRDAIRRFVMAAVEQRDDLLLPAHGGPPVTAPATLAVRTQVHRAITHLIARGRADGTIVADVTARDVVALGAMLAQPGRSDPAWTGTCRRLLTTYLDGLASPRT